MSIHMYTGWSTMVTLMLLLLVSISLGTSPHLAAAASPLSLCDVLRNTTSIDFIFIRDYLYEAKLTYDAQVIEYGGCAAVPSSSPSSPMMRQAGEGNVDGDETANDQSPTIAAGNGNGFGDLMADLGEALRLGAPLSSSSSSMRDGNHNNISFADRLLSPLSLMEEDAVDMEEEDHDRYVSPADHLAAVGSSVDRSMKRLREIASFSFTGQKYDLFLNNNNENKNKNISSTHSDDHTIDENENGEVAEVTDACATALRRYAQQLFAWRNYLYSFGVAITLPIEQCGRGLDDVPLFKEAMRVVAVEAVGGVGDDAHGGGKETKKSGQNGGARAMMMNHHGVGGQPPNVRPVVDNCLALLRGC